MFPHAIFFGSLSPLKIQRPICKAESKRLADYSAAGVSVTGVSTPVVTLLSVAVTFESVDAGAAVEVEVSTLVGAGGAQPNVKATTRAAKVKAALVTG
ncbi:MAG: hypothetical protein ACR2NZ_16040 [Rubripirellula sp.]